MKLSIQSTRHTKMSCLQRFLAGMASPVANFADGFSCLLSADKVNFAFQDCFGFSASLACFELPVEPVKHSKAAVVGADPKNPAPGMLDHSMPIRSIFQSRYERSNRPTAANRAEETLGAFVVAQLNTEPLKTD